MIRSIILAIALLLPVSANAYPLYVTMHNNNSYFVYPVVNGLPYLGYLFGPYEVSPLPPELVVPNQAFDKVDLYYATSPHYSGPFYWAPAIINRNLYLVYRGNAAPIVVPEPNTIALVGLGLVVFMLIRKEN